MSTQETKYCESTYCMVTEVVKIFNQDLFEHVQVSDHYLWYLPNVATAV